MKMQIKKIEKKLKKIEKKRKNKKTRKKKRKRKKKRIRMLCFEQLVPFLEESTKQIKISKESSEFLQDVGIKLFEKFGEKKSNKNISK